MGKSRYAKTKTAGEVVGLSRYGKQFGQQAGDIREQDKRKR